ncbi:PaaI family thioesterase [Stackebrandtia nassauensis]|uniref:PaaI family thioesterase n=1 Tax=Stackebrandtia nassauensis TaxID=283811 RepID=UPI0001A39832|nr:PaaI family thioesterase [Stackebrandtia nassauensis]
MTLSIDDGNKILRDNFAPWVQDLGLEVVALGDASATLRLPHSPRLNREGGALCGQAMMAAADTATVIAISSASGGFRPMTTVQQSTTFRRPVLDGDVTVVARIGKLGRTMAFVDIDIRDEARTVVAQASTVYAILG